MNKTKQHFLLLLLLLPLILRAQWIYSGSIQPSTMNRISDGSILNLPLRIAEIELGISKDAFDFKTNSALEYRWKTGESEYDLREAYLVWYPSWGELKVGKQIHAWGAVDGNNPTDNLNPYDYYYLFLPGTDRKIGILSGSMKYYWNDLQVEAVVIPDHEPNRFPFGEEDFPISQSPDQFDPRDYLKDVPKEPEIGFNIKITIENSDFGFSYFTGRDRAFSLGGYSFSKEPVLDWPVLLPDFSYRKTTVIGSDFVTFLGDWTVRGEGGYFQTKNDFTYDYKNDLKASYLQYAFQLEYLTPFDLQLTGQIIGNHLSLLSGMIYEPGPEGIMERDATEEDFQPGMGTPFAMFTDLGMFLSTSVNFWDNTLEIRLNTFLDLEESQSMFGGGFTYSPMDNWEIDCSVTQLTGAKGTIFHEIKDFSNLTLGIKYSF